jgi:hypothetical protein
MNDWVRDGTFNDYVGTMLRAFRYTLEDATLMAQHLGDEHVIYEYKHGVCNFRDWIPQWHEDALTLFATVLGGV